MGDLWADEGFGGEGFGSEGFGDEDDWSGGGESLEADVEDGFDDLENDLASNGAAEDDDAS